MTRRHLIARALILREQDEELGVRCEVCPYLGAIEHRPADTLVDVEAMLS